MQLKKLKAAVKDQIGTTLRISLKMFNGNDLWHDLLITTRQKINMSTDLKLSRAQISKIIQSGGFLGSLLSQLADALMKVAIPWGKNILPPLGITAAASAIDAGIQKKQKKNNTWFWNHNFNNFKWRNEWYNEDCSSSWRF